MEQGLRKSKYKVNIENIFPSSVTEKQLFINKECIVGISMNNPIYWRSSLYDVLLWTSEHFEIVYLVVGDLLYRHNLEILAGNSSKESYNQKAIEIGDKFIDGLMKQIDRLPKNNFSILRWKDILIDPNYGLCVNKMLGLYTDNLEFKNSITTSASDYISSLKRRNIKLKVSRKRAIELSSAYLIEELGIFNKLISEGKRVIIYPGRQLPIFVDIAERHFNLPTTKIKNGIYIQLNVIRR